MPLSVEEATSQLELAIKFRAAELDKLDKIHQYLRDQQAHPAAPAGATNEVKALAKISRVNLMDIVVSSVAQSMYVDGYRSKTSEADADAWRVWQANGMDARQIGVHRATLTYGTSYLTVLPGSPVPVMRGYSPREMTALYTEDDDVWPAVALRVGKMMSGKAIYKLYDADSVYTFSGTDSGGELVYVRTEEHGVGRVPVIRFLNQRDEDEDNLGEVEPLFALQDQVNMTTFGLLTSQHYAAFRQRYIIGWTAANETALLKAGAARIMTFEDSPEDVSVGEFAETQMKGYLDSREASLRHAATLSQTPVHELIGSLVNLSAEALVAAETGQRRKVTERQISMGESWEQALLLAAEIGKLPIDLDAQVRWRDTEARALSATVDALGKMAQMLGVPPQELWERIPNVSQQDIERWKISAKENDAITALNNMLNSQANPQPDPADVNA